MSTKNIEIRMAVTGADQAAAEINKTETELQDVEQATQAAAEKLGNLINIQRAQVAAEIAQALGQIGSRVKEAAYEFKDADPEFSKTLDNVALGLDSATSAANGAAQGFAVGGPFGAAIGLLAGAALPSLSAALDDMTSSLAGAARSEAQAAEMARRLAEAQNGGMEATLAAEDASVALTRAYENETAAADALIAATERRNKVAAAESKADDAAQDRADAAAIRNGADPENVRINRANRDEAKNLAAIDSDLATKETGIREISNATLRATGERDALKVTGAATPEQLAEADKKVTDLESRLATMQAALEEAKATAPARRREIRETTAGQIEDLSARRSTRQEEERKQAADQAAQAQLERAEERLDGTARRDGASFRNAGNRVGGALGNSLTGIAGKLSDGTDEKEIAALREQFIAATKGMGGETIATMRAMLDAQLAQGKEIATIRAQIKNARTAR